MSLRMCPLWCSVSFLSSMGCWRASILSHLRQWVECMSFPRCGEGSHSTACSSQLSTS